MITEICGERPDSATFSKKIRPKPSSAPAPSWRRAPPDSMKPTTGICASRACRSADDDHVGLGTPTEPPEIR